jgi:hypothetical protein
MTDPIAFKAESERLWERVEAEAPAVIREAPMNYDDLRTSFQMLESDLHAENERLGAELSALRSSLSGVIAEMARHLTPSDREPFRYVPFVTIESWLATLKRLQGDPEA